MCYRSGKVKQPEWVDLVKTALYKELAPFDEDWFLIRMASLARHIYIRAPIGVKTAKRIYGGEISFITLMTANFYQALYNFHFNHFCSSKLLYLKFMVLQCKNVFVLVYPLP